MQTDIKKDKIQHFVNLYRQAHSTNAGLNTKELDQMSDKNLDVYIASLKKYINLNK